MFRLEEIEKFYSESIDEKYGTPEVVDIDSHITRLRNSTRRLANKHLLKWIVLIDQGIHFLIHFDRLTQTKVKGGIKLLNLWAISSKLKSLAISFRELTLLGQADSSRIILRVFLETSDLFIISLANIDFCENYAPDDPDHNDSDFWKRNIAYGKVYSQLHDALLKANYEEDFIEKYINWKKNLKSELSGSVHSASWSTYQACLIPSLSKPGMIIGSSLGHLSAHSPALCRILIEDMLIISEAFQEIINNKNTPVHLRGFPTGNEYASVFASIVTFRTFFDEFYDDLDISKDEVLPI